MSTSSRRCHIGDRCPGQAARDGLYVSLKKNSSCIPLRFRTFLLIKPVIFALLQDTRADGFDKVPYLRPALIYRLAKPTGVFAAHQGAIRVIVDRYPARGPIAVWPPTAAEG